MKTRVHPNVDRVFSLDQGVAELFGYKVIRALEGECLIGTVVSEKFVNAAGFGHGSLAFTLMDTASAYALASIETIGVTVNANVSYVKGVVAGEELQAYASILTRSKRMVSLRSEATVADVVVAHGTFLFQLLDSKS